MAGVVVVPAAAGWLVGWQMERSAKQELVAAQSFKDSNVRTPGPSAFKGTIEDKQLAQATSMRTHAGDIADAVATQRMTLAMLQAAGEAAREGTPEAKARAYRMANACSKALKDSVKLATKPTSPEVQSAVDAMLASLKPEPASASENAAAGTDPAPIRPDGSLPTMWAATPTYGIPLHELTEYVREVNAWIRADQTLDPQTKEDLVFLAEAMGPTLLGMDTYANRAAYTRVAPLLALQGCEHPIALLANELTLQDASWTGPRRGFVQRACEGFKLKSAPVRLQLAAYLVAANACETYPYDYESADMYYALMCEALVGYMREHACKRPDGPKPSLMQLRAAAAEGIRKIAVVSNALGEKTVKQIGDLRDIDECVFQTISGTFERAAAWRDRGSGYAGSVRDAAWELFHKRLEKAYNHFQEAWTMDPKRPEAAVEMIAVAMGGGAPDAESEEIWFDRAIKADPRSRSAYDSLMWALRPRWGGTHQEMERLGVAALKTKLFDSAVPAVYLKSLEDICEDGASHEWLAKPSVSTHLNELAQGYAESGRHSWDAEIATWRLIIAFAKQDYEAAAAMLADPKFEWHMPAVSATGLSGRNIRFDSWAFSGPTGDAVKAADALLRASKSQEAADAYAAVLVKAIADGAPTQRRDALEDRLATARLAAGLNSGDWYSVPVDARMHGWRLDMGYWGSPADGSGVSGGVGAPMSARLGIAPGQNFETSVDLLVWDRSNPFAESSIQFCSTTGRQKFYYSLNWFPNRKLLQLTAVGGEERNFMIAPNEAPLSEPQVLHVTLSVWQGRVEVTADGKQAFSGALPYAPSNTGNAFSMGTSLSPHAGIKSGFRDLKIRRLTSAPEAGALKRTAPKS